MSVCRKMDKSGMGSDSDQFTLAEHFGTVHCKISCFPIKNFINLHLLYNLISQKTRQKFHGPLPCLYYAGNYLFVQPNYYFRLSNINPFLYCRTNTVLIIWSNVECYILALHAAAGSQPA